MREKIIKTLKEIEADFEVKICYAVESGSRAWGFPSQDSDYDVRFIYVHKPEWYLSIEQKREVIELPINDLLDMNGWELRKSLRLFKKSNPSLLEWLHSPLVYCQDSSLADRMRAIQDQVFIPKAAMYHYISMAKGNYRTYLLANEVQIKKYFYVLRPVFACKWIEKYHSVPPIEFLTLMEDSLKSGQLKQKIYGLLEKKISGGIRTLEPRNETINIFAETEIERLEKYTQSLNTMIPDITPMLDELFREVLKEVWLS